MASPAAREPPQHQRGASRSGPPLASTWQSAPPQGVSQDTSSKFVAGASAPAACAVPTPDAPDFWLLLGPREGAAAIVPQAGGPATQVSINLVSVAFKGTVSLSLDTTQGGTALTGVSGRRSPQQLSLTSTGPLTPVPTALTITTTSATPEGFAIGAAIGGRQDPVGNLRNISNS
jgi:hypothetical protein